MVFIFFTGYLPQILLGPFFEYFAPYGSSPTISHARISLEIGFHKERFYNQAFRKAPKRRKRCMQLKKLIGIAQFNEIDAKQLRIVLKNHLKFLSIFGKFFA